MRLVEVFKEHEARQESWARLINSQRLLEDGSCGLFYASAQLSGNELNDRLPRLSPWCSMTSTAMDRPTCARSPTPSQWRRR